MVRPSRLLMAHPSARPSGPAPDPAFERRALAVLVVGALLLTGLLSVAPLSRIAPALPGTARDLALAEPAPSPVRAPGIEPSPSSHGAFSVSVIVTTPNGVNQPATLPAVVTATATPNDVTGCPPYTYIFDWGDGTAKTTNSNNSNSARHYYLSDPNNINSGVTISVNVTDCHGSASTGYVYPTFYPAVTAVLQTDLGPSTSIARNLSVLHMNFTVTNLSGGAYTSSPTPYFLNWSFGDGSVIRMQPAVPGTDYTQAHTFFRPSSAKGPSVFLVTVSVTDRLNGNATSTFQVQLNGSATAPQNHPKMLLGLTMTELYLIVGVVAVAVAAGVALALRRRKPTPGPSSEGAAGDEGVADTAGGERASRPTGPSGAAHGSTSKDAAERANGRPTEERGPKLPSPGVGTSFTSSRSSSPASAGVSEGPSASGPVGADTSSFPAPSRPSRKGTPGMDGGTLPGTTPPGSTTPSRPIPGSPFAGEGVPCIICGTMLPSVDSPCPKCTPTLSAASQPLPEAAPSSTSTSFPSAGPPLPGLERSILTPLPLQVAPREEASARTGSAEPTPLTSPASSYLPVAPPPELEPLPVTHAPVGPEPGVDTTPVKPLPPRPSMVSEEGRSPSPASSDAVPSPQGGGRASGASLPATSSSASSATEPPAPASPAPGAAAPTPFLFPVSSRSLFEKLVDSAPTTSEGGERPGARAAEAAGSSPSPSSSPSTPTATSAPSAPPTPERAHPSPRTCLVCGGTLQGDLCPSCKMNWRE